MATPRRSVDWPLLGPEGPHPGLLETNVSPGLGPLLGAVDELVALDDVDAIVKRAVQLARERIGLVRAAIFLLDERQESMLGTWGTALNGELVDEHHVMFHAPTSDQELYERSAAGTAHWTVFENCPIVEQLATETRVVGRGWVACTPIRSARRPIGMMFNDAGLSGAPFDHGKQAQTAVFCSLLATILDLARGKNGSAEDSRVSLQHPTVTQVAQLLTKDPSLGGAALAKHLGLSLSRLARVFKAQMGMSLVEYRNGLRLQRFLVLVDSKGANLLEAALESGFGSYAQFHRVFRLLKGTTPSEYLRARARQK